MSVWHRLGFILRVWWYWHFCGGRRHWESEWGDDQAPAPAASSPEKQDDPLWWIGDKSPFADKGAYVLTHYSTDPNETCYHYVDKLGLPRVPVTFEPYIQGSTLYLPTPPACPACGRTNGWPRQAWTLPSVIVQSGGDRMPQQICVCGRGEAVVIVENDTIAWRVFDRVSEARV